MPKVSVVIPVFNGERFIGDAIQSVLNQTFQDFEIILVDDGSSDETERIAREFSGSIAYHRQQNQGAGIARNLGVALAQGDWMAFLDADDVWHPDKLAVLTRHVETYPDVAFFYSDMDIMDETGYITETCSLTAKPQRRKKNGRPTLVSLVFNNRPFPYPSTVLVRKDVFLHAGGFNPAFHGNYHEDFEAFARVARISPIHFIPRSLVKYRVHSTPGDQGIRDQNWLVFVRYLRETWRNEPEKLAILEWYFVKHYSDQGKASLRAGDYRKARQYFHQVFSHRPLHWISLRRWVLSFLPGVREFYIYWKTR